MTVDSIVEGISKFLYNDNTADYIVLREGLTFINQISSIIIGILVVIIVVFLPIVIAIEVCYINLPVVQSGVDNLYDRLEGRSNKLLGLTIRDATKALKDSRTTHYGTSVNLLYLKIKCKYIFLSVFIVAMLLGAGSMIVQFVMRIVSNIVSIFL